VTPLSAVLITHNEERNLAAALESVRFCDEIVVVDSGSTDRTREIAETAGARVVRSEPWPGFVAQRNLAADAARHDWILAVDADERVTAELRDEIQALRAAGFDRAGYRIPRVALYLGRWIRATDWYPDAQLRLFDRTRGRWQGGLVHESVRVDGGVGRLRSELQHHPYDDIGHHMRKIDSYTTLWAREAFAAGRRTGTLETLGAPGWAFLRNYVLKRGFLLGEAGLTVSLLNTHYTHAKLAKLRELMRADGRAR
jgi:glycosyltransferase involved in cell wall biosynthesis